jgi:hypothetical protein
MTGAGDEAALAMQRQTVKPSVDAGGRGIVRDLLSTPVDADGRSSDDILVIRKFNLQGTQKLSLSESNSRTNGCKEMTPEERAALKGVAKKPSPSTRSDDRLVASLQDAQYQIAQLECSGIGNCLNRRPVGCPPGSPRSSGSSCLRRTYERKVMRLAVLATIIGIKRSSMTSVQGLI